MTAAALGGEIEVPTIDGKKARVSMPEGTQTGKQFRLKGKGMPVLRSNQAGDMYIQVTVETPVNLSRRQRELLRSSRRKRATTRRNRKASSPRPAPSGKVLVLRILPPRNRGGCHATARRAGFLLR